MKRKTENQTPLLYEKKAANKRDNQMTNKNGVLKHFLPVSKPEDEYIRNGTQFDVNLTKTQITFCTRLL